MEKNYPKGMLKMSDGTVDYLTDDIEAIGLNDSYTFNEAHEFYDDITANELDNNDTGYDRMTLGGKTVELSADVAVDSVTRSGSTVTVTVDNEDDNAVQVAAARAGDVIQMKGANETDYNGFVKITTKVSDYVFEYEITGTPTTPATGTILFNWNRVLYKANRITYSAIDVDPVAPFTRG